MKLILELIQFFKMGEFIIKNKGFKELYLNRNYNSSGTYSQFKDDGFFNDGTNPFSDYMFQVTCGVWQNDKIKILSLPDKGRLFYLTNPNSGNPIYSNVTLGQMILVRDLIDNKVLKFNAEGDFDNQYSLNYLTEFKFERFCGADSNNIISSVKLNMVDARVYIGEKYELFITQTCEHNGASPTNYDVYCTGQQDFAFQQILNTNLGFVRMTTNGGTSELGISKQNGGALVLMEVMSVNTVLTASLSSPGINAPGAFPYGYPSQPVPASYVFQYSLNGVDNWIYFYLNLRNA